MSSKFIIEVITAKFTRHKKPYSDDYFSIQPFMYRLFPFGKNLKKLIIEK